MVDLIRNNGFNENPLTRLNNPDRITRTIDRFITASVEAYCPGDRGKIASIAAYRETPPGDPTLHVTAYTHGPAAPRGVMLASVVVPFPAGEIAPTKPLPVPALQPQLPQEVQPAPQEPPPPPRHVQQVPKQAPPPPQEAPPPPEEPPPPAEAPPPEPPPAAAPPAAPAPAPPAPPPSPPPDPPSAPGHVRIAP